MINKIESIFTAIGQFLSDQWNEHKKQKECERIRQQQNAFQSLIYDMMTQMAIDLYEIFKNESYGFAPVMTPASIHISSYQKVNNTYQYKFALNKKTYDRIIAHVLKEMTDKMNSNLMIARRDIVYIFGRDYLNITHPFLAYGMHVVSIQDLKSSEVLITVQTNLTPQAFYRIYRQNGF